MSEKAFVIDVMSEENNAAVWLKDLLPKYAISFSATEDITDWMIAMMMAGIDGRKVRPAVEIWVKRKAMRI